MPPPPALTKTLGKTARVLVRFELGAPLDKKAENGATPAHTAALVAGLGSISDTVDARTPLSERLDVCAEVKRHSILRWVMLGLGALHGREGFSSESTLHRVSSSSTPPPRKDPASSEGGFSGRASEHLPMED